MWEQLELKGSPPSLDGQAILLAGTGQSNSCPLRYEGLRQRDDRVILVLAETQDGKPVNDDATCTADLQSVLFVV